MTTLDYRQFSSDSTQVYNNQKKKTRRDLHHLTENNCQVSPDRVVRRSIHEFPSAYNHSSVLGHELTGCQISKLIHLHTARWIQVHNTRIPDVQPGRQQGKAPGSQPGRHQQRAAYFPRVRCTTRDTGCHPIDSFVHWTLSAMNLEMKHWERHVCSNDQTTKKKRACNRRNTERRKNGKTPRAIQYCGTYQDRSQS